MSRKLYTKSDAAALLDAHRQLLRLMARVAEQLPRQLWLHLLTTGRQKTSKPAVLDGAAALLSHPESQQYLVELSLSLGGIWGHMSNAELSDAHLKLAWYDTDTSWPEGFSFESSGALGPGADLSGVNLSEADLPGINLSGANLSDANLQNVNLIGSDLSGANLRGADLTRALLQRADLHEAALARAILRHAVYDRRTKWPRGFNVEISGALLRG